MLTEEEAYEGFDQVLERLDMTKLPIKTVWMLGAIWATEVVQKRYIERLRSLQTNLDVDSITTMVNNVLQEHSDVFKNVDPSKKSQ